MSIIKNKIIWVYGDPWSWKTMITLFFVAYFFLCNHRRIYSNVDYYYWDTKINHSINNLYDIQKIKFSPKKGLLIIDEGGLNINSRRSSSKENLEYSKLAMLWRKKNIDIVLVAQLDYSIDKYFRDLSFASLHLHSFFTWVDYLKFEAKIYKKDYFVGAKEFDLFRLIKGTKFNYNTLEESEIDKTNHDEIKRKRALEKAKKAKRKKVNKKEEKQIIQSVMESIATN